MKLNMSDIRREVAEIIMGGGCHVERWDEALERSEEIITFLTPKLTGEWISMSDAMPELHEYVLLLADRWWNTPDGVPEMKVTAVGYLADSGGEYWSILGERGMALNSFTDWMPMPPANKNPLQRERQGVS